MRLTLIVLLGLSLVTISVQTMRLRFAEADADFWHSAAVTASAISAVSQRECSR